MYVCVCVGGGGGGRGPDEVQILYHKMHLPKIPELAGRLSLYIPGPAELL